MYWGIDGQLCFLALKSCRSADLHCLADKGTVVAGTLSLIRSHIDLLVLDLCVQINRVVAAPMNHVKTMATAASKVRPGQPVTFTMIAEMGTWNNLPNMPAHHQCHACHLTCTACLQGRPLLTCCRNAMQALHMSQNKLGAIALGAMGGLWLLKKVGVLGVLGIGGGRAAARLLDDSDGVAEGRGGRRGRQGLSHLSASEARLLQGFEHADKAWKVSWCQAAAAVL